MYWLFHAAIFRRPRKLFFELLCRRTRLMAIFACPQTALLEPLRDWPGLRTVVAVESVRSINGSGKVDAEIRYFLSSCTDAPEMLAKAIRQHWAIENSLHWVLDVTFREDDCRVRDRTAVRNFALLRKLFNYGVRDPNAIVSYLGSQVNPQAVSEFLRRQGVGPQQESSSNSVALEIQRVEQFRDRCNLVRLVADLALAEH